uniref:Uncharacterized protein n=1 Tax=Rhizophora mucronata TaxID=61149 RepID=A0A2P2J1P7_RHIMU
MSARLCLEGLEQRSVLLMAGNAVVETLLQFGLVLGITEGIVNNLVFLPAIIFIARFLISTIGYN